MVDQALQISPRQNGSSKQVQIFTPRYHHPSLKGRANNLDMNVTHMNPSGHRNLTESKMKMTGNNLNHNENISDPPPIKIYLFQKK